MNKRLLCIDCTADLLRAASGPSPDANVAAAVSCPAPAAATVSDGSQSSLCAWEPEDDSVYQSRLPSDHYGATQ